MRPQQWQFYAQVGSPGSPQLAKGDKCRAALRSGFVQGLPGARVCPSGPVEEAWKVGAAALGLSQPRRLLWLPYACQSLPKRQVGVSGQLWNHVKCKVYGPCFRMAQN